MFLQPLLDLFGKQTRPLTRGEKIMMGGTVGIFILGIILLLQPALAKMSQAVFELATQKTRLETLVTKRELLVDLNSGAQAETYNSFFTRIERYLPSHKPSLEVLLSLNRLARVKQVNISGISLFPGTVKDELTSAPVSPLIPDMETDESPASSFDINFVVSGKREQTLAFIQELSDISPLMKIEDFSIVATDQQQGVLNSEFEANLTVRVFYQPLSPTIPQVEEALAQLTPQEVNILNQLDGYLYLDKQFSSPTFVKDTDNLGKQNLFGTYED